MTAAGSDGRSAGWLAYRAQGAACCCAALGLAALGLCAACASWALSRGSALALLGADTLLRQAAQGRAQEQAAQDAPGDWVTLAEADKLARCVDLMERQDLRGRAFAGWDVAGPAAPPAGAVVIDIAARRGSVIGLQKLPPLPPRGDGPQGGAA